jgi:nucleoside-diphosphate-sugar epimerase
VFSSGNVYPLVPVVGGGATEHAPVGPIGEYAQSVLGRERLFEYFSGRYGTRVCLLRLNYAIDLRYGVLLDIASKVFHGQPVDVSMSAVNVIWQGDANSICLRSFSLCRFCKDRRRTTHC